MRLLNLGLSTLAASAVQSVLAAPQTPNTGLDLEARSGDIEGRDSLIEERTKGCKTFVTGYLAATEHNQGETRLVLLL